jgi:hypothetical protein
LTELICDKLLNVHPCDIAEAPLSEVRQNALTKNHPIPTLCGELQSRQDEGCPFAFDEILQTLNRLRPLLSLIQHLQMLVELCLSLSASWHLAQKPKYNRPLNAS